MLMRHFTITMLFALVCANGCTKGQDNEEDNEVKLDIDRWIGEPMSDFEAEYGSRGNSLGSGLLVYDYEIDDTLYVLSVAPREDVIINITIEEDGR